MAQLTGGGVPVTVELVKDFEAAGVEEVVIGVRPEDLRFAEQDGIAAMVSVVESLGHERHVVCRLTDQQLVIVRQDAHEAAPAEGSSTHLVADAHALHVFDPTTGARIGT